MKGAGAMRRSAAAFWLNLLFWLARRYPLILQRGKPLFLWGGWTFSAQMRHNTLCNARRILGEHATPQERSNLAKAVIGSFYDFVCDVGRCSEMAAEELRRRVSVIHGNETYQAVRRERKGAIILTAHLGSFEVGIAALLEYEKRIHVLFRRDAMDLFEKTRSTLRKRLGVAEAPVDEGLATWMRLRDALAADEVVLIQGDRVMPGQKGIAVLFLGGHMLLPLGPVKLALATGAPIVPVFSVRDADSRISLFVEEPVRVDDEAKALRAVAMVLEKYVQRYPQQWLALHRAWREDVE